MLQRETVELLVFDCTMHSVHYTPLQEKGRKLSNYRIQLLFSSIRNKPSELQMSEGS